MFAGMLFSAIVQDLQKNIKIDESEHMMFFIATFLFRYIVTTPIISIPDLISIENMTDQFRSNLLDVFIESKYGKFILEGNTREEDTSIILCKCRDILVDYINQELTIDGVADQIHQCREFEGGISHFNGESRLTK